jgi:NitT/TauT family transport system substrate-binding protein
MRWDHSTIISRRAAIAGLAVSSSAAALLPTRALATEAVTIGIVNTSSDAPFFIAQKLGYFKEAGLAVKITPFPGAPAMIAPLGAGQLDAGGGAPGVGLYNAIHAKIDVRMVADKGSAPVGYGYGPLMVRKELVTSGRFKSVRDLKGLKFAESAPGSALSSTVNKLLETAGLKYDDVQHVYLGFPQQISAFAGGSIDAALTAEPNATVAERMGVAVRVMPNDKWYPGQEQAVVFYGSSFLRQRREAAERFMTAYIRAARYYADALIDGHLRGRTAGSVIDIVMEATGLKDRSVLSDMTSNWVDPNGRMNVVAMAEDLNFFKLQGLVTGDIQPADAIDNTFQVAAAHALGPYHAHTH